MKVSVVRVLTFKSKNHERLLSIIVSVHDKTVKTKKKSKVKEAI